MSFVRKSKSPFEINLFGKVKINLLILPVIAASVFFGYSSLLAASYLCAVLHEAAHIFTARIFGIDTSYVELQPFGICARLRCDIIKNPVGEILIALSGPLVNFALAFIFRVLNSHFNEYILDYLFKCNIGMALINLLPALPLDGGRVTRAALSTVLGTLRAYNITSKISKGVIFILLAFSTHMLLTHRFNLSLILIGIFLLGNLLNEQKNISKAALDEILHYKSKLKSGGFIRSVVITADKSTPARRIFRRLSYNRYHIIHVTDDKLRIIKTLTEGELIEAICNKGIRITLGDIQP